MEDDYRTCTSNSDCSNNIETTCSHGFCICINDLKKATRDGKCRGVENYKECVSNEECYPDAVCFQDKQLNKTVCLCVHNHEKTDRYGQCIFADDNHVIIDHEEQVDDVIKIHQIPKTGHVLRVSGNDSAFNNSSSTVFAASDLSDIDGTLLLQIFIPITALLMLAFVLVMVCLKKSNTCYKNSKRSEKVIKNSEDVQLLDRMNFVNKNPTYFFSERENGNTKGINSIPYDKITLLNIVGEGAFGQVYRGQNFQNNEAGEYVAVKILKDGVTNEVKEDFEREVDVMSAFQHENILKLIGIVHRGQTETPYMVFEYMVHGDLADLLRKNDQAMRTSDREHVNLEKPVLIDIATQIANGMMYLTSKHFVHRDLATRNCLVGEGFVVKISDFGMARDVYTCDYYRIGGSRMLPVRWMSPESMKYGQFTTESDIWAFGVVLWEIFSYGRQPYYGHTNEEVVRFLDEGILLQRPDECPSTINHIMLGCWKKNPKERIPFTKIHKHLVDFSKEILRNAHLQRQLLHSESQD